MTVAPNQQELEKLREDTTSETDLSHAKTLDVAINLRLEMPLRDHSQSMINGTTQIEQDISIYVNAFGKGWIGELLPCIEKYG